MNIEHKFALYALPDLEPEDKVIYRYLLNLRMVSNSGIIHSLKLQKSASVMPRFLGVDSFPLSTE